MRLRLDGVHTPDEFYLQALMLAEVVKRILKAKGEIFLASQPKMVKKPITEFMRRMRVNGLSKFDEKTYISCVNFYENETAADNHKAVGAIVLYVPDGYVLKLFRQIEYPVLTDDEPESIADACGSLCNLIAGNFKNGLTQLGYKELYMTPFASFENEIINGIDYDPTQTQVYEITFDLGEERRLVVDLTMGLVPRISDF